jgi:antitoxin VapB
VLIPRDLELPGDEATIGREGDALVIEPMPAGPLLALLASWDPLGADESLGEIADPPLEPI